MLCYANIEISRSFGATLVENKIKNAYTIKLIMNSEKTKKLR